MTRAKSSVYSKRKRKRLFKLAKGFWGNRKNHLRLTKDAVMKALAYNYEHRKDKKRDFRILWIMRINTAARINGLSYSKFMNGLKKIGCKINRKYLAILAVEDKDAFKMIANLCKKAIS